MGTTARYSGRAVPSAHTLAANTDLPCKKKMRKKLFLFEIILFVSKVSKNRNLYLSFSYFIFLNNCVLLSCRRNLKDPPRRLFNNVKILLNPLKLVIVKFGLLVKVLSTFVNHYKPSVIFAWRHFWFFFSKTTKMCVILS